MSLICRLYTFREFIFKWDCDAVLIHRRIIILIFDRGPNWIHGTVTNPIVHLAKTTNTALCLIEDSMNVFDQYGQAIEPRKANEFFKLVWSIIAEAFKYSNEECSQISPTTSLKDFFTGKVSEKGFSNEDRTLILQMAEIWGAFIGDPWDKQSLKYFWLEECLDGGEFTSDLIRHPEFRNIPCFESN
jgi:hypothetical protein